ncbi:aldo-keto reductase [Grosmannia clavigera kw1407]|uniref:Aldo-keto reductase n=1 Tax=Grosmannia clavigera (strain kw1407 / UAMH 11150) TaxID=655863 RepID=F0X7W8_GROCL|nr:aldo-keto reductase [Grosmannia clavigera kw1407]EFX06537.1 aldo-keto reductase [Grosmannia clavigera kw1407]
MAAKYTLATKVKLRDGKEMPQIQLGLYMMSTKEAAQSVKAALASGYRGFDCAQMYHNEQQAGKAIRSFLQSPEGAHLDRKDVFYTSKLAQNSAEYEAVRRSITESVTVCGLGYIDLFLLHSPYGGTEARQTSWQAVEDAIDAGEVRSGGVSNYGTKHIDELTAVARIPPVVNQIEVHPFNTRADIRNACAKHDIIIEAYAPLVRGMRMSHPTIQKLAKRHGCTPAQLLVRWSLQHGLVPLPKSINKRRMTENANVNGFVLSDQEMKMLNDLDEYLVTDWDPTTTR